MPVAKHPAKARTRATKGEAPPVFQGTSCFDAEPAWKVVTMSFARLLLLPAALLALSLVPPSEGAAPPASRKRVPTDYSGDPLPPSAIARIGTLRFRHGGQATCVTFTRDGKAVVSGGEDNILRLWEADTGEELRRFVGHEREAVQGVEALAISPDGKTLASGGKDGTVRLWGLACGRQLCVLKCGGGMVHAITFSPDGKVLASAGNSVRLWKVDSGKQLRLLSENQKFELASISLTFARDGKVLVAGGRDGVIRFWDVESGRETFQTQGHADNVCALAFSPDGKKLASGGEDGVLRLWDAKGKTARALVMGGSGTCSRVAFSPDSRTLVWRGGGEPLRLFAVATGRQVRSFEAWESVDVRDVAFSPDGKRLATAGGQDGVVRIWHVASGRELSPRRLPEGSVSVLAVSPNGGMLATAGWGPNTLLWDLAALEKPRRLKGRSGDRLAFAFDGQVLTSLARAEISLWQVASGRRRRHFEQEGTRQPLALSAESLVAAFTDEKGGVFLMDVRNGKQVSSFGKGIKRGAFSLDGKALATGGEGALVGLWDVKSGTLRRRLRWPTESVRCFQFSPDGTLLAGGCAVERAVHVLDVRTGEARFAFKGGEDGNRSVAFSPDGRVLAAGGHDGIVRVWEIATGKPRMTLEGHRGPVEALAYSADGRRLASGSADSTALVWDLTGEVRRGGPLQPLTAKALVGLWADLMAVDAARAYRAIQDLAEAPGIAVPYLGARLQPAAPTDPKTVARLLQDLDSKDRAVQEKAWIELEKLRNAAAPALREALKNPPSEELARQLKRMLKALEVQNKTPSGERLRELRVLEALERAGGPAATQVLQRLAKGAPEAQLTQEARRALERLKKRAPAPK